MLIYICHCKQLSILRLKTEHKDRFRSAIIRIHVPNVRFTLCEFANQTSVPINICNGYFIKRPHDRETIFYGVQIMFTSRIPIIYLTILKKIYLIETTEERYACVKVKTNSFYP